MILINLIAYALEPLPHMNADRARVAAWVLVAAGGALTFWFGKLLWTNFSGGL